MTALALEHPASIEFDDIEIPIPAGFRLASGDTLADAAISVRCVGRRDGPQVIALGGISAGRDVCGVRGWWRETLIDHDAVDLRRFGLIGFDFTPTCDQRVRITPQDQARLIEIALSDLGVARVHAVVGASYGGMVGLALAARAPERVGRLCVISAAHQPSALALAWRGVQRRAVEFGIRAGDAEAGLSLARQLAMITYRTGEEFTARFGAGVDAEGRGEVDRYLEARGEAYARSMAPRRWLSLSEAIDRFAIDPAGVRVPTALVACPEDQLVPIADIRRCAELLPNLVRFEELPSLYGHDAFLKEPARLAPLLRNFLESEVHV